MYIRQGSRSQLSSRGQRLSEPVQAASALFELGSTRMFCIRFYGESVKLSIPLIIAVREELKARGLSLFTKQNCSQSIRH